MVSVFIEIPAYGGVSADSWGTAHLNLVQNNKEKVTYVPFVKEI